ncbi:hypothetical protein VTH06DRAFT_7162 [Thermothelomyces fergusii]
MPPGGGGNAIRAGESGSGGGSGFKSLREIFGDDLSSAEDSSSSSSSSSFSSSSFGDEDDGDEIQDTDSGDDSLDSTDLDNGDSNNVGTGVGTERLSSAPGGDVDSDTGDATASAEVGGN